MALFQRRSLSRFAAAMLPSFEAAPHTRLIIRHLEKLAAGEIRKLCILAPPRHGKSLLCDVMLPAWALGRNPREQIICATYGSDLSEGFGRRTRNIIGSPEFQAIFPNCKLSPDSSAVYHLETTLGGEASYVGRGGVLTGRGASLLLLDDLLKDASEANSEAICRSVIEWIQTTAFTRLTPNGRVLLISTRWGERDPAGWVLQQPGWVVLRLPALAESGDPLGRKVGEALWPAQFPVEVLERTKRKIGSRAFACLYQADTATAQGAIFRREWFQHYTMRPEKILRIVQSWDTGFKTGAMNDFSVCTTWAECSDGYYLLALYRTKADFPTLKGKVSELADAWKPSEILIEDRASGQSLIQELKLSTSYPVIAVKIDRDKETRAASITGYFEAGKVYFPQDAAWLSDLEDELCGFPSGQHDDIVDSITQFLNRARDGRQSYGVLDWFKKTKEKLGTDVALWLTPKPREPKPEPAKKTAPDDSKCLKCPSCGNSSVVRLACVPGRQWGYRCNQCGTVWSPDGAIVNRPEAPVGQCCGNPLPVRIGNMTRCNQCGRQTEIGQVAYGISRKDFEAANRRYGRGWR